MFNVYTKNVVMSKKHNRRSIFTTFNFIWYINTVSVTLFAMEEELA